MAQRPVKQTRNSLKENRIVKRRFVRSVSSNEFGPFITAQTPQRGGLRVSSQHEQLSGRSMFSQLEIPLSLSLVSDVGKRKMTNKLFLRAGNMLRLCKTPHKPCR